MEARNRDLTDWYGKIKRGEIKLPYFQRPESWDRYRICSLIETIIHNLPLGITLVLDVGEKEKFTSRFLETAEPKNSGHIREQLLDGQQRLTALWRVLHNNYVRETYFIYVQQFDDYKHDEERADKSVFFRGRYVKKNGRKYPLWCDDPSQCLNRGFIPTNLLKPEDMQGKIEEWAEKAVGSCPQGDNKQINEYWKSKNELGNTIRDLREIVAHYNLPYLSLPVQTEKSVALNVFINMNTNSKPLSTYDIVVAEVAGTTGKSLHDLQDALNNDDPNIVRYSPLSDLILTTSALLQNTLPNQRGAWNMDKRVMVKNWDVMKRGLSQMAEFLQSEGIYDRQRLPTNAVLAVIAALYADIPKAGDKRGVDELLLKKYLWYAFFTDRYENSAATSAYADFVALRKVIRGELQEDSIPIFRDHKLVETEELLTTEWPNRSTIRGRAILAVACRLKAFDFATGEPLTLSNIKPRHYHHVYPDALLKEAEINGSLALNCALIVGKTNISIGRKDPLEYMKDRYKWTSKEIIKERLQSHLIPIDELANGGYQGMSDEQKIKKLQIDFSAFIYRRAELIMKAVKLLIDGHQLNATKIYEM